VRRVWDEDLGPAGVPLFQVVRAHDQNAGELTLGAGRWLQGDGVEATDLGQHPLQLPHQLEATLDGLLRLERMGAGEAWQ
jgi:hypothetical protein